ncbi:MAG: hypothetical protein ABI861_01260, partial [Panacibacter sp.]
MTLIKKQISIDLKNIDWKIVLAGMSTIISIISLIIAIRIFHKRDIQKKQIELILELISNIQKKTIWLRWLRKFEISTAAISLDVGSLFSISRNYEISNSKELNNLIVYFSEETMNRIDISKFLINPLLPKDIANALRISFRPE